MHPNASHGTIAPISPKAPVNQTMVRGDTLPQQHTAPVPTAVDLLEQSVTVGQQGGSGAANDLVGLFDNVEIAQSSNSDANPFDLFSSVDISSSELPGNASTSFSASGSHEFTQAPQQRTPTVVNQNPNQVTQVLQQPPEQRQQPVYGVPPQQQQRPITPLQYASNSVSQGHQSARLLGPNGQPIAPQQFQQSPLLDVRQPQVPPGVQPGAPQYGAPRQVPGAFPQQHYQPGLSAQGGQKAHPQHQQQLQQHPQQQRQQHLHQQQQQQTQVHPRQLGVQPGYFPHHQAPPPGGYNPQQQLGQSVPPPPPYPSQLTPPPQHYQPYQSQPPQPSQQNNVSQFDPLAKK